MTPEMESYRNRSERDRLWTVAHLHRPQTQRDYRPALRYAAVVVLSIAGIVLLEFDLQFYAGMCMAWMASFLAGTDR